MLPVFIILGEPSHGQQKQVVFFRLEGYSSVVEKRPSDSQRKSTSAYVPE